MKLGYIDADGYLTRYYIKDIPITLESIYRPIHAEIVNILNKYQI